jgi:hypothetical protein
MELYHVSLKFYKNIFLQVVIVDVFVIITSYCILYFLPFQPVVQNRQITTILLTITIFIAGYHTIYTKKQIRKLAEISDFDERVKKHIAVYRIRMLWYLGSCLFSCMLYFLTTRNLFLYFALFDLVLALPVILTRWS